jgi:hypothetical protein
MADKNLPVKTPLKRINSGYIWHEFQHILHFERGFLYTMKGLMLQPGKTVREFLLEDRTKAVKPIIFILVISTVVTLVLKNTGDKMYFFSTDSFNNRETTGKIYEWFNHNIGYSFIIMGIYITFWVKLFFRKHPYNFWELLVSFCYFIGQSLFIFFILIMVLNNINLPFKVELGKYIGFIYLFWATGQFFGEKKFINYVKSTIAIILGGLSFMLITQVLVQLVDFMI